MSTFRTGISTVALAIFAFGATPAISADLGGNCCADLEERVAELEATTARKGNRKVKLTVSGQVNEALLFWDDGAERNVYVVSNNASRTRFRFVGDAKINADWSAGYLLEIGARYANTTSRTQFSPTAGGNNNQIDIRHSAWYLDSKTFGRVWVGKTGTATEGITEINLANSIFTSDFSQSGTGGSFRLRRSGRTGQGGLSALSVVGLSTQISNTNVGEGDRNNVIKYVSPTFLGFSVQGAYGEDKLADVALRYAGELGSFRVAGGIGYRRSTDINATADGLSNCSNLSGTPNQSSVKCDQLGLSASAMHTPTGLYLTGAYGTARDSNKNRLFTSTNFGATAGARNVKDTEQSYYLQGGIEQKWFSVGKTTLYGEYFRGEYGAITNAGGIQSIVGDQLATAGSTRIAAYNLDAWGLGLTQSIDAAAMDLYISYRNYQHDLTLTNSANVITGKSNPINDSQFLTVGGIIRF